MYTVAIIGAGLLGSRHLQGLKTTELELCIEVLDPNPSSLELAKQRYEEIKDNRYKKEIHYLSTVNEISNEVDLLIIATSSAPRFSILQEIVQIKRIKNILFEKVLFQKEEDYYSAKTLLTGNNIKAWINCPRRVYNIYSEVKEELKNESKIIFTVTGGEWGLGCNSIHFIDCLAYITNETDYSLSTEALNNKIYPSKRLGYIEFCGTLAGKTQRGDLFNFISQHDSSAIPMINIKTQNKTLIIDEVHQTIISLEDKIYTQRSIKVPYQSELTGLVAKDILVGKSVKLATYDESMKLHLPFITSLLNFYNHITGNNSRSCPIT